MDHLRSKYRKKLFTFKENNKLYYKEFPHYIKISITGNKTSFSKSSWSESVSVRDLLIKFGCYIKTNLNEDKIKVRQEWHNMTIFCQEPEKVIDLILKYKNYDNNGKVRIRQIGVMLTDVLEHIKTKPSNVPKAVNTVVKKLPFDRYRYKVYFAGYTKLKRIGSLALEAIIDQINASYKCSSFNERKRNSIVRMNHFSTNYFYTEDEEIFPILFLINPEFITKIEKMCLPGELNESQIS